MLYMPVNNALHHSQCAKNMRNNQNIKEKNQQRKGKCLIKFNPHIKKKKMQIIQCL